MSKEAALAGLAALTGAPAPTSTPNPSLITGDMNASNKVSETGNPEKPGDAGLAPSGEAAEGDAGTKPENESALSSTQLAIIKKREVKIFQEREQLKKDREEFAPIKTQALGLIEKAKTFEAKKAQGDIVGALEAIGLSHTEIINLMATEAEKKELSPQEIVQAELAKRDKADADKAAAAQAENDKRVIDGFKSKLPTTRTSEPDKFEYCNFYDAEADEIAFNLVKEAALDPDDPQVLTPQEAMEEVENFYYERDQAMSKLKKRNPAAPTTPAAPETPLKAEVKPGMRGAQTPPRTPAPPPAQRKESHEEKKARLAERLRNGG